MRQQRCKSSLLAQVQDVCFGITQRSARKPALMRVLPKFYQQGAIGVLEGCMWRHAAVWPPWEGFMAALRPVPS